MEHENDHAFYLYIEELVLDLRWRCGRELDQTAHVVSPWTRPPFPNVENHLVFHHW